MVWAGSHRSSSSQRSASRSALMKPSRAFVRIARRGCCASPMPWMISRRRREGVQVLGSVNTRSWPSATTDSLRTISIRVAPTGSGPVEPVDPVLGRERGSVRSVHIRQDRAAFRGGSPMGVAVAAFDWALHLAASPGRQAALALSALSKQAELLQTSASRKGSVGDAPERAGAVDRRFADEEWGQWSFFARHRRPVQLPPHESGRAQTDPARGWGQPHERRNAIIRPIFGACRATSAARRPRRSSRGRPSP